MTENVKPQTAIVLGNKEGLKRLLDMPDMANAIKAIANKYMNADRITKLMILATNRSPRLLECTPRSFFDACIKSAELGLDFGGATGQAYLVPFKNGFLTKKHGRDVYDCTFIPGYQGLLELVYRGAIATYVDAQIVHKGDKFKYNLGINPAVEFEPNIDDEPGEVRCAFAIVRFKDSEYPKIEIMSRKQLLNIKARSKARDSGPWVTDEDEMMRKTVLRRALKYIPKTPEIEEALAADNTMYDFGLPKAETGEQELGVNGLKKRIENKDVTPAETATEKPPVQESKRRGRPAKAQEAEQPEAVLPDEIKRYICLKCNTTFDEPKPGGLCPNCLSDDTTVTEAYLKLMKARKAEETQTDNEIPNGL